MKYSDVCTQCDHVVTAYTHNLNYQLVGALEQIVLFHLKQDRVCNLQKDLDLTKNQYNNFQKLQYFGLVEHTEKGWNPTEKGIGFIRGKSVVYNKVATYGKEILPNDHVAWKSEKRQPKMIHIGGIKNYVWKPKAEYQLEKTLGLAETLPMFGV